MRCDHTKIVKEFEAVHKAQVLRKKHETLTQCLAEFDACQEAKEAKEATQPLQVLDAVNQSLDAVNQALYRESLLPKLKTGKRQRLV